MASLVSLNIYDQFSVGADILLDKFTEISKTPISNIHSIFLAFILFFPLLVFSSSPRRQGMMFVCVCFYFGMYCMLQSIELYNRGLLNEQMREI